MKTLIKMSLAAVACALMLTARAYADNPKQIDVPAGDLVAALESLAKQAEVNLVYQATEMQGLKTEGVSGTLTPQEAVAKLLKGTSLRLSTDRTTGAMMISAAKAPVKTSEVAQVADLRLVQTDPSQSEMKKVESRNPSENTSPSAPSAEGAENKVEEIVVTGTSIRGAAPVGSPLLVIDREEIDRSGFATAQDLIKSLPQNFRGETNEENTISDRMTNSVNVSRGAGVNLRGLGTSSTLVLLNGRRMAQAGGLLASYVDVSMLPLSAIERVEVLTDGASAIYGSDAIAGVINFVLRKDYEGLQTSLRYGAVTDGGFDQTQVSQVWGKSWDGGNVLASYEYDRQGHLDTAERELTASSDLTRFGGDNFDIDASNPGTIQFPALAALPRGQDGTVLQPEDLILGEANLSNGNEHLDLFSSQKRHSLLLAANQSLAERVRAFGELRFLRREVDNRLGARIASFIPVPSTHPFYVSPPPDLGVIFVNYDFTDDFGPQRVKGRVQDHGGALGVAVQFRDSWQLEAYGSYDREKVTSSQATVNDANLQEALGFDNPATPFDPQVDGYFNLFADGSNTPRNVLDFVGNGFFRTELSGVLRSVHLKLDGELLRIAGGALKLALGSEYRQERLARGFARLDGPQILADRTHQTRDVTGVFAELSIPVIGPDNGIRGARRLELSLAGRHERYNDFGSTTDPKIGILWSPARGLNVRGSYGTSFKAPNLPQVSSLEQAYLAFELADPAAPGGSTLALVLQGSNPGLTPETSTAWTAGIDWRPFENPAFNLGITYFDIHFEDRIGTIGSPFDAFTQAALFAPIVTRDPDDATVQAYLDSPLFLEAFGRPPAADVAAIVDSRFKNLATTDVNGLDVLLSYRVAMPLGALRFDLNGNYLFGFEQAVSPAAPVLDLVSQVHQPVDFKWRGGVSWAYRGWEAATYVNYLDNYRDRGSVPERKVGSWTTLDLNLQYEIGGAAAQGALSGTQLSLSAQNLFDADPPFVNNPSGMGYDPENASVRGRFIAAQVSKKW